MGDNNQNSQYWGSRCLNGRCADASSGCASVGNANEHNVPTGQDNAWNGQQTASMNQGYTWNGSQSVPPGQNSAWGAQQVPPGGQAAPQVGYQATQNSQHQHAAQWANASQQQYVQPHLTYDSGKNHITAGLLAIFLGGLGIHKFYLGCNSVGFIMLGVTILGSIFTLGLAGMVMWVIGVVEGIIYLSKDQETFDRTYVYGMKEWF